MSGDVGAGSEEALELAILQALAANDDVKATLGDPPRVFDIAEAAPAYPYLEILRHETRPAGSAGVEASEHRIDLSIASRAGNRKEARAALAAVRSALSGASLSMEGWRCIQMQTLVAELASDPSGAPRIVLRIRCGLEVA